jgi:EAL domain-containing protein (putative c-di-GMP-specific phosphodiesterase class I)
LHAGPSTLSSLQQLHDEGVGIAIDDFGMGYASLRYLATLPVTTVKIDKSFTAGLPEDSTSSKIVRAVAGLAADMHLDCVVEGVETAAQLRALPAGVRVQGYLTGRPLAPALLDLESLARLGKTPRLPSVADAIGARQEGGNIGADVLPDADRHQAGHQPSA